MGCSLTIVALLTPILIAVKVILPSMQSFAFFLPTLEKTLLRPQFGHFGRKWPCRGAKIMMFLLTLISLPCRKYQNDDDEEEEDCEDYDIRDNGNHLRPGQPQSTR